MPPVLYLVVAWVAVMFALHLVWLVVLRRSTGHNPRRRPPAGRRKDHIANFEAEWEARGSGLLGWARVYWPLLRVGASRDWLRIRTPRRSVWIAREACDVVARGSATRFDAPDGRYDGITLWVGKADELATRLGSLGWDVAAPNSS